MDTLDNSSAENNQKQILNISRCEQTKFENDSYPKKMFEVIESLRKNEILCDVRLETDDGTIIFGHKVVLVSASPYFRAMFCNFVESNKDIVKIRELDSIVLQLLVNYIYTGEIMISGENVQVLLPAANILQLDCVSGACADYIETQMDVSNCFGIKAFAELHDCTELMTNSDSIIKKQFLEVVQGDEFLSLSSQEVIKLISCDDLGVPFEDIVFECVIKWVKFKLDCRKDFLPELMEHVRLPLLASTPDLLKTVLDEPLLKNSPKFKDYAHEALYFNLLSSLQDIPIPQTIRCKPRRSGGLQKIILLFIKSGSKSYCRTEWYDPATKLRKRAPGMNNCRKKAGLGIIRDQFVIVAGGVSGSSSKSVNVLDLSSQLPCWKQMADMLVSRRCLGVGVLNDCIYAIGGCNGYHSVNSAEVFDVSTQKWRMLSNMFTKRQYVGVGVLNNYLYALGGYDGSISLKTVECYDPTTDSWTSVEEMTTPRHGAGVGVLNGIMYAVGGCNSEYLNSVEAFNPSTGVWSDIANMHFCRFVPGVVALDGLFYVIGGENISGKLNAVEIYNPITNTWVMENHEIDAYGGVVVDKPFHFTTNFCS